MNARLSDGGAGVALRDDLVPTVEAFLSSGPDIDAVGEMVVAGIRARSPWIFTGEEIRPHLEQRMAALLSSL